MNFEEISFDEVKIEIKKIFPHATLPSERWNLTPDSIHKLAESARIKLPWQPISWWSSFETGNVEIPYDIFFNVLFEQIKPTEGKIIIVTDECFSDELAYILDYQDLEEFIIETYPTLTPLKMDFFQPLDCIFIFPKEKILTILHHEGFVMQFQSS